MIGSSSDDAYAGAAYVYARRGGVWSLDQKLVAEDVKPFAYFGAAVALSGDTAMIELAGTLWPPLSTSTPATYVFERKAGVWTQRQKLMAGPIGLDGQTAVIGDPSSPAAYVFVRHAGTWTQWKKLTVVDTNRTLTGVDDVTLSRDTAMITAGYEGPGAVYVFTDVDKR